MGRVENAVVNAEAYMEQLARELSILDGVSPFVMLYLCIVFRRPWFRFFSTCMYHFQENIHSIMESEGQVNALMNSIDISISALDEVESELTTYEDTVTHVQKSVEKIEEENLQMGVVAKNNHILLTELASLIDALDFPHASQLLSVDLRTDEGIRNATEAAFQLQDAFNIEVPRLSIFDCP